MALAKCVLVEPRATKLLETIKEKGLAWSAAALVEGSIGYYSPWTAKQIIEDFIRDQKLYGGAERTSACFRGDPYAEMEFDFKCFMQDEQNNPERAKRYVTMFQAISATKGSVLDSWGFSCAYPTMAK